MTTNITTVELAAEMTIAWLGNANNRAGVHDVPVILRTMHDAVARLSMASDASEAGTPTLGYTPAVSARKSLENRDYIISLIDGTQHKSLRRHLAKNGLTPEGYRERYGLKADYPMVSEGYSELRRAMAMKIGLGRTRGASAVAAAAEPIRTKLGVRTKASKP